MVGLQNGILNGLAPIQASTAEQENMKADASNKTRTVTRAGNDKSIGMMRCARTQIKGKEKERKGKNKHSKQ